MTLIPTQTAGGISGVGFLDIMDPAFGFDTAEALAAREAHWYARTPLGAIVLRYAEVAELSRDHRLGEQGLQMLAMQGITDGPLVDCLRHGLIFVEDDTHARLRKLVNQAFTPRRVAALGPMMGELTDELLEPFAATGHAEFMTHSPTATRSVSCAGSSGFLTTTPTDSLPGLTPSG
jgi:hypothetical protein